MKKGRQSGPRRGGRKPPKGGRGVKVRVTENLERINEHAAGIDIGSESHFVAVPPGTCSETVREYGVFTRDLYAIADWLLECGVRTVAMESTGVYWVPLYEALEERGFEVKLVDARKAKNVSGRKTDVLDCQWLQQLESYGLLSGAYRPPDEIVVLRGYMRQREMLVRSGVQQTQHMQKALQQMNLRLERVVSDITGQTGMRIIKAILSGERDAGKLGLMRNPGVRATSDEIAAALMGNYRQEHLFALKQAVELYEIYRAKIVECEAEMERYLGELTEGSEEAPGEWGRAKRETMSFSVRGYAYQLTGVDLFAVTGLNSEIVLRLISEVGVDLSAFPSEKHFSSWLGLSPNPRITGGRVLSSKTKANSSRAAAAFRQAAVCVQRSENEFGAFYRRMRARKGPAAAVTATAHKLARVYYSLIRNRRAYEPRSASESEEQERERAVARLAKRARQLGMELVEKAA